MTKLILVGCGNMGYAMLAGWCASGPIKPTDVIVVEPSEALRARAGELGVGTAASGREIPVDARPELIVFAVKPQMIADVVSDYRRFAETGSAFLSVAAGTRLSVFSQLLGDEAPIIRCMPNTPAAIGAGMLVTVANDHVSDHLSGFVSELLSANGEVVAIDDEGLMDAVTALSGSGPAYVFHFIECMTAAGVKAGLPEDVAAKLAGQTVLGAARLAAQSNDTPTTLREQVTSPNGTTAAALDILMTDDRLKRLIGDAVEAARKRSVELG